MAGVFTSFFGDRQHIVWGLLFSQEITENSSDEDATEQYKDGLLVCLAR
ncbi:MAG: hypothetical protein ACI97A_002681 [Planctomycetota bacterium]|jgi:hypothetical protein